ncbi:MAG: fasciclin domain-containing protein [Ilumatobacteraceae bacterium]
MKKVFGLAVVACLSLVACGTDESTVVDTTAPMEAPMESDIVAVASSTEGFSTLVAALTAGLVETLQGEGPFTVFAPNDEAFAALPAGLLDKLLLPENVDTLTAILTYHVVAGKVGSMDVVAGDVPSVEGSSITLGTTDGVQVNDAMVILADVEASNGVIHVIDKVIVPPTVDLAAL